MTEENRFKNIRYVDFINMFNVKDLNDWNSMVVREDGVWVKPLPGDPPLLFPETEGGHLLKHPNNDPTTPALKFPCSYVEVQQLLKYAADHWRSWTGTESESDFWTITGDESLRRLSFDAGAFFNSKQTDNSKESVSDQPDKAKESVPSTPIERDEAKERALWKKHIEPIINKHNLKTKEDDFFKYEFYHKDIYNDDVLKILRQTMGICRAIQFPKAGVSANVTNDPFGGADDFITEIVCRLRDAEKGPQKYCLKDHGQIDLRDTFRDFLDELFAKQTLPAFLELLRREVPAAKAETEAHGPIQSDESIKQRLREVGKKGGKASKINKQILEAARLYLQDTTQKLSGKSNEGIAKKFCNKYKESTPMSITIDNNKWEVFCQGEIICSRPWGKHDRAKSNNKEKTITSMTFWKSYISKAKKSSSPPES